MANDDVIKKLSIDLPNISPATLGKLDSLIKSITKNVESATAIGEKFYTFNKQIENLADGKANASFGFAVNPNSAEQIEKVIKATLKAKVFGTAKLNVSDLQYKTHDIELFGSQAIASAKKALMEQGSELVPKGDNTFSVFTPYNLAKARSGHAGELTINKLLAPAFEKSNAEKDKQIKIEQQLKEKEEEKKQQENDKNSGGFGSNLLTFLKLGTIVTALRTLVNLTRKILSATLQNAQEKLSQVVSETGLNLPSGTLRAYKFLEEQKGLDAGTFEDVFTAIRDKFADIGNIDLSALEKLAPMLKGSTVDLIQSGVGGKNPEALAKEIISDVLSNVMQGKNAYGQKVGTPEEALKDVIPVLNAIDSGLSDILSRLVYENIHGTLGATAPTGVDSWLSNPELNPYGITSIDLAMLEELADSSNKLKTQFDLLGEKMAGSFAGGLNSFIKWLSSFRFMMSSDEKIALNKQNYEIDRANLEELQTIAPQLKEKANYFNKSDFTDESGYIDWTKIDTQEELENAIQYNIYFSAYNKARQTMDKLKDELAKKPSDSKQNVKNVAISQTELLSFSDYSADSDTYARMFGIVLASHKKGGVVYTLDDYEAELANFGLRNGYLDSEGNLLKGKTYKSLIKEAKENGVDRALVGKPFTETIRKRFDTWASKRKKEGKSTSYEDFINEVIGDELLDNTFEDVTDIVEGKNTFPLKFNMKNFEENLKDYMLENWSSTDSLKPDAIMTNVSGKDMSMNSSSAKVELAIKVDGKSQGTFNVDSNGNVWSEGNNLDLIGITQNRSGLSS